MRLCCPLLLLFLSLATFSTATRSNPRVSGWTPIKDVEDPQVAEIANFAVTENDKQTGQELKLVKVVAGETQVISGTIYRLVLGAKFGSATNYYVAIILDDPSIHFRVLTLFKRLQR